MTRNVLLVYLKNLRDLEVAKYKITAINNQAQKTHNKEVNALRHEITNIEKGDIWEVPNVYWEGFPFSLTVLFISLLIELLYWVNSWNFFGAHFIGAISVVIAIGACIACFCTYPRDAIKKREKVIAHNEEENRKIKATAAQRIQKREQLIKESSIAREAHNKALQADFSRICQLLQNAYSLNILPNQYRNLASVYYIYDYMSSSQASLEETLMHEHMENGIQRILEKLDTIIAQNEELILSARRIEANTAETANNTRQMLANEQRMLESMERTEQNTAEAAQAARVASQYSEINAFFSTAEYLDRQRGK